MSDLILKAESAVSSHLSDDYIFAPSKLIDQRISFKKISVIGALAIVFIAIGYGIIGFLGIMRQYLLRIAPLGAVGVAISAYASRREQINQDERNSERYQRAANILSQVIGKFGRAVGTILYVDHSKIVVQYAEAVEGQLSLEHRQWTSDASEMTAILKDLENNLKK